MAKNKKAAPKAAQGKANPAPAAKAPPKPTDTTAPVYSYPAHCFHIPAPISSYPARTWAYQPGRSDSYPVPASSSSVQDYSQPNRNYILLRSRRH